MDRDPDRCCTLLRIENRILLKVAVGAEALSPILDDLCEAVQEEFDGVAAVGVYCVDEDGRHLTLAAGAGLPLEMAQQQEGRVVGLAGGSSGACAFMRKPVVTSNIAADPFWRTVKEIAERHGFRACWELPIVLSDGSLAAVFSVFYSGDAGVRRKDLAPLERIGRLIGFSIECHRRERELQYRVRHDDLTGLPNRSLLIDWLDRALLRSRCNHRQTAVLLLDLDGFKPINDRLGHRRGDMVLVKMARRIRSAVRKSDMVARLGGDEFVVVLEDVDEPGVAERVAQNLIRRLCVPLRLGTGEHRIGASIGISLFPTDAYDGEGLIDAADAAMYEAKRAGGQGYRFAGTLR